MTLQPILAALVASLLAAPALAQPAANGPSVARAFLAAARADDRPTVLRLLDEQVSVRFPDEASGMGEAVGRAFAVGYLDGLLHGQRVVRLDSAAPGAGGAIRILAHDVRSQDRYAIDLQIQGARVVGLTISRHIDRQQVAQR